MNHKELLPKLVGTAGTWFVFDVTFYANALFAPVVLAAIFQNEGDDMDETTPHTVNMEILQLLIVYLIGLPGYFVAVYFMDSMGRKNIQLVGFTMMALLYLLLAIQWASMGGTELIIIYGLTFFFANFGPNTTTFILPSETFQIEIRTSMNGISAAAGKVGALVGTACFAFLVDAWGIPAVLGVCAGIAAVGAIMTQLFVIDARYVQSDGTPLVLAMDATDQEGDDFNF